MREHFVGKCKMMAWTIYRWSVPEKYQDKQHIFSVLSYLCGITWYHFTKPAQAFVQSQYGGGLQQFSLPWMTAFWLITASTQQSFQLDDQILGRSS